MQRLQALARVASRVVDWLAISLFIGMCALVLAQVAARKLLDPLVWSEELARYVFIWVCFLGWVIGSRNGSHLAADFLFTRVPPRVRAAFQLLCEAGALVLGYILLRYGLKLVENNWDVDTVTLFFSYGFVYAIVPASAVMMIAIAINNIAALARLVAGDTAR
jgi:TRAP-type C4-dicarboxylate transport system permease small subunit